MLPGIRERVQTFLSELLTEYPDRGVTVMSFLAKGADQLVAEEALQFDIPLIVPLPTSFDAAQVDSSTIVFGPSEASPVHDGHVEDVNGDGFNDMVFHFKISDTGIACGDMVATVTGETFEGDSINASDAVKTAGCK